MYLFESFARVSLHYILSLPNLVAFHFSRIDACQDFRVPDLQGIYRAHGKAFSGRICRILTATARAITTATTVATTTTIATAIEFHEYRHLKQRPNETLVPACFSPVSFRSLLQLPAFMEFNCGRCRCRCRGCGCGQNATYTTTKCLVMCPVNAL